MNLAYILVLLAFIKFKFTLLEDHITVVRNSCSKYIVHLDFLYLKIRIRLELLSIPQFLNCDFCVPGW